jgi:hypothetical protein
MLCTALPALASTRFPRLYELSSLVRAALISIGSVLTPNRTVDIDPASIAMADMEGRYEASASARVGSATHLAETSDG